MAGRVRSPSQALLLLRVYVLAQILELCGNPRRTFFFCMLSIFGSPMLALYLLRRLSYRCIFCLLSQSPIYLLVLKLKPEVAFFLVNPTCGDVKWR